MGDYASDGDIAVGPPPDVSDCLNRAEAELLTETPQGVVNACVLLATASKGLERETFEKVVQLLNTEEPESAAVEYVQESMEKTFDHTLEALGHIAVLGICETEDSQWEQLKAAKQHARLARINWNNLITLKLSRSPNKMQ